MSSLDSNKALTIGIDFGGVLSSNDTKNISELKDGESGHINVSIDIEGALEGLKSLKNSGHKLVLISFCGKRRAIETAESIKKCAPGLFDKFYFTKKKDYKKHICVHAGVDIFIDDTYSILADIANNTIQRHLIHFTGNPGFEQQENIYIPNITTISSWPEIVEFCSIINPHHIPVEDKNINKWIYTLE